LKKLYWELV